MKQLNEILENWKEWEMELDDRFGARMVQFVPEDKISVLGFELKDEYKGKHQPKEWNRENILEQLKKDVAFGVEKAEDKRGISSNLMFEVVRRWNKVLEEGLEDWSEDNYSCYGMSLFRVTAKKYGWDL